MKKAWKWFSGKKRAISVIGLAFFNLTLIKSHINPDWLEAINWFFTTIGGIGIIHAETKRDKSVIRKSSKYIKQLKNK